MKYIIALTAALFIGLTNILFAQNQYDSVEIKTIKVDDGLYMLQGAGGNIGISSGVDGIFMIDDQFAPLTPKILAAIKEISPKPVKFVINTHWHFDHTGGNENLGKDGVIIVAHDNVYKRLNSDQFMKDFNMNIPAAPKAALPVVTFNDRVSFHMNGLEIQAQHFANAHTDGDSVIFFKNKNTIHTGDIFFNGFYPYIDSGTGGSIYGMIKTVKHILGQIDDQTKIIPGHGPLANKQDLQNYQHMLAEVVKSLEPLAQEGLPLEEAIKRDPLKNLNETWGGGFLKPEKFIEIIYATIQKHTKK